LVWCASNSPLAIHSTRSDSQVAWTPPGPQPGCRHAEGVGFRRSEHLRW
jgi:hypothetical protein